MHSRDPPLCTSAVLGLWARPSFLSWCWDGTQVLSPTRQAFYRVNHLPSHMLLLLAAYKIKVLSLFGTLVVYFFIWIVKLLLCFQLHWLLQSKLKALQVQCSGGIFPTDSYVLQSYINNYFYITITEHPRLNELIEHATYFNSERKT